MTGRAAMTSSGDGRSHAFQQAMRHSRRIRLLKIGVPVLAVLLACFFAGLAWFRLPAGMSIDLANTSIGDGQLVMANPKLGGYTRDNEPYSMSAVRAIQDVADSTRVKLEQITAELPFDRGNAAVVDAGTGYLDRVNNRLELMDGLTIETRDGMRAQLSSAVINLPERVMQSDEPVEVTLEGARLSADTMRADAENRIMIFEKRVRLHIDPSKFDTALEGSGGNLASK